MPNDRLPEFPHLYVGFSVEDHFTHPIPALRKQDGGTDVAKITLAGYRVGAEASPRQLAQLFATSPKLYNAAKWAKSALENPTDKLLAKEALEHINAALEDARREP